ncbi:helix-turn-helix domain-containing protein [Enterococcus faecalis]|uniref:helix-turn-helix domain-containing protein n=1 Tax=Enterococcus faecalis TaxID=1351 RepID=UPI0020330AFC|nr:helix-turn-helix domain-containing protein [Enterococcus faecalis]
MATINEIAKELNVSRVRVYQIVAKLPEDLQPNKVNGHYRIEDKNVKSIKEYFTKSSLKLKQDNNGENEYKIANKALEDEVQTLKEQLTNKDEHIKDLTQLLDQSQRLQLDVQNKLNKLENKEIKSSESTFKSDKNEDNINTNQESESPSMDTREANNEKRSNFWSQLFRGK